jgi:hypothetical protein
MLISLLLYHGDDDLRHRDYCHLFFKIWYVYLYFKQETYCVMNRAAVAQISKHVAAGARISVV